MPDLPVNSARLDTSSVAWAVLGMLRFTYSRLGILWASFGGSTEWRSADNAIHEALGSTYNTLAITTWAVGEGFLAEVKSMVGAQVFVLPPVPAT